MAKYTPPPSLVIKPSGDRTGHAYRQGGHSHIGFLSTTGLLCWLIVAAVPFLWIAWGSFKVEADFFSKTDWRGVLTGSRTLAETGMRFTTDAYSGLWIEERFWRHAGYTLALVSLTVIFSLTFGLPAAYALSRSDSRFVGWFLLFALLCRALPHVTLVTGFLPTFFVFGLWGSWPVAVIVLVAINQPFTLWLLYAFFRRVPRSIDESALLDGCTRLEAFRQVVLPLMWPAILTTALCSFLLAYNDFAVTGLLLSREQTTIVPATLQYLGTEFDGGKIMYAVAAVVSVTAPLLLVVWYFQRRLMRHTSPLM